MIDPAYAIEPYLAEAEQAGVRIVRVLETHNARRPSSPGTAASALEHDAARLDPHRSPRPSSLARAARGRRRGHGRLARRFACCTRPATGRSTAAFLVGGHLLTGDSLLVGDAARPDLAIEATRGRARISSASLRRLSELPDGDEVDPGHTGGSLCGAGHQRREDLDDRHGAAEQPGAQDRRPAGVRRRTRPRSGAAAAGRSSASVALNRGPVPRRPQQRSERLDGAARPAARRPDCRRITPRATRTGRCNVPASTAPRSGRRPASCLDARRARSRSTPPRRTSRPRPPRRLERGRPARRCAAYVLELETPERLEPIGARTSSRRCSPTTRPRCSTCARRTSATRATSGHAGTFRTGSCGRSGRRARRTAARCVTICSSGAPRRRRRERAGGRGRARASGAARRHRRLAEPRQHQLTAFRRCGRLTLAAKRRFDLPERREAQNER